MPLSVITAPEALPISVSEVREALALDHTEHDVRIARLIEAVVSYLHAHGRVVMTTVLRYSEPGEYAFRCRPKPVFLPGPVASVEAVTITDEDGDDTVLDTPDDYTLRGDTLSLYRIASVRETLAIDFTAGYSDDPEDVPAALRGGILQNVIDLYASPESYVVGTVVARLPRMDLLAPFIPLHV